MPLLVYLYQIESSLGVFAKEVPLEQAKQINGVRAVFGEVYPDPVRVVSIGASVDDLLKGAKSFLLSFF